MKHKKVIISAMILAARGRKKPLRRQLRLLRKHPIRARIKMKPGILRWQTAL